MWGVVASGANSWSPGAVARSVAQELFLGQPKAAGCIVFGSIT